MRLAAGIEYRGSRFDGWQRQAGRRTVQQKIESALTRVANHPVTIQCAGRTDAGVHAVRQIAHFDTTSCREGHSWVFGANSNLPGDVNLNWVVPVCDGFHARFSARSRRYRYYILNRRTRTSIFQDLLTWETQPLDVSLMARAAACLVGEHDFSSYRATACQARSPVRRVMELKVWRQNDLVIIEIEANAFLHHMVRNIAGVLIMIGQGKQGIEWAQEVLLARDRSLGGITAPPNGLFLLDVVYDDEHGLPGHCASEQEILRLIDNYACTGPVGYAQQE